jgi:hypothetical protein
MSRIKRQKKSLVFYNPLTTLCLQPSTLVLSWPPTFLVKILTSTTVENGDVLKTDRSTLFFPFLSSDLLLTYSGISESGSVNICTDLDTLFFNGFQDKEK